MSTRLPHSCFIHIPRTGGTWLHNVVARLGTPYQILKGDIDSHFRYCELPENWRKLASFSFVRHPWGWVASRWSHALENNTVEDFRHYGVHRVFDELVRPSFEDTLKAILEHHPGIVGYTYSQMLRGVDSLCRTESLPMGAYNLLREVENLTPDRRYLFDSEDKCNSTTSMDRWRVQIEAVPDDLREAFIASEPEAIDWWNLAERQERERA